MLRKPMSDNRFVVFYINFSPYIIARLRALARVLPEMLAVEIADYESKYPRKTEKTGEGFEYRTLFHLPFESVTAQDQKRASLSLLEEVIPSSVLVVGYAHSVMRSIAMWSRKKGIPCIMTTDTTGVDRRRFLVKELAKKWWCNRYFDALFLPGERSANYFASLRFPEERIWRGTSVVDNSFFAQRSQVVRDRRSSFQEEHRLPQHYFLTVCRLSPEKNIVSLLEAFANYRKRNGKWDLVIAGTGPQEDSLRRWSFDHNLSGVHFVGWKHYSELPAYYALASCFILPSISEPWGLVVNEAMACGLPVLVSRTCGCQPELCHRGINGYDFNPHDPENITDTMMRVSSGEYDLEAMGTASRSIIANFTTETWALSLQDCVLTTLNSATGVAQQR
jgi:1,2-diacylglycerol 3-alpha-glucosyltransferase